MAWHLLHRLIAFCFPLFLISPFLSMAQQTGRVKAYDVNRIGDYEGFRIRTATGETSVHFPPHVAEAVRKVALVGQPITIWVEPHPGPAEAGSLNRLRLVSLQHPQTGQRVRIADLPPPPPQAGKRIVVHEPLAGTLSDDRGQLIAIRTATYLIELKPHQSEAIRAVLAGSRSLQVVGYERTERGFVNQTGLRLIRPATLTIHGKTFAF
ncbi:hypothetical protein GCM10027347_20640 [Larkinella harenae]